MPFFLWPMQGALTGPERYLFPALMTHTTGEVVEIWDHVSFAIRQALSQKKGIHVTGLGTFGVLRQELRVGKEERLPLDRPLFELSHTVEKFHGLHCVRRNIADFVPVVSLDYGKLALATKYLREAVKNCIRETLLFLSRCVSQGLNVDFSFRNVGVLSIRGKKVKMRFYEEFAFSVDELGYLKEVLTTRKRMVNWVIPQAAPDVPVTLPEADILFPQLQFKTERGELLVKSLQKRAIDDDEEEEQQQQQQQGEDYFPEKTNRKGVLPALVLDGAARRRAVDLKEGLWEKSKRREPTVRRLPELQRSSWREEASKKTVEGKPRTEPLASEHFMEAIEKADNIAAEWNVRKSLLASTRRKEKQALADWAEYEAQRARNDTHGAQLRTAAERLKSKKEPELNLGARNERPEQEMNAMQESSEVELMPRRLLAAHLRQVPESTRLEQRAKAFSSRASGQKQAGPGKPVEEQHHRNTWLLHSTKESADKTKQRVFLPHPPAKGKNADVREKPLKDRLLVQGVQVRKPLQRSEAPLRYRYWQESTGRTKESIKTIWMCSELQQTTEEEDHKARVTGR